MGVMGVPSSDRHDRDRAKFIRSSLETGEIELYVKAERIGMLVDGDGKSQRINALDRAGLRRLRMRSTQ